MVKIYKNQVCVLALLCFGNVTLETILYQRRNGKWIGKKSLSGGARIAAFIVVGEIHRTVHFGIVLKRIYDEDLEIQKSMFIQQKKPFAK